MPKAAKPAAKKAESTLSKTVAAVREKAAATATQAASMASSAGHTVQGVTSSAIGGAKDLAQKVGDVVGNAVDSVLPGNSRP